MKISVIIPSYKPEGYIQKCLSSVLTQDFPSADYEVIIVLNGCLEPYKSQIEEFIESQSKQRETPATRLIQTDHPGVSHARNLGLDEAQGDYFVFIDDDDYISPNYLSARYELARPNTIVASNAKNCSYDGTTTQDNFITRAFESLRHSKPTSLYAYRRLLSNVCGKIIPKQIVGETRFHETLSLGEDSVFIAEISKHIKEVKQTAPDVYYYVTVRANSASRKKISNWEQISNALELAWTFCHIYLSDVRSYNFPFFLSRIIASLLKMLSKKLRAA